MSGANSKKAAAQKARLEREAAERAAADRKKRLYMLGGAGAVVVLVIAIILLAGSDVFKDKTNGSKKVDGVAGLAETQDLTKGLQQNGTLLGNPNAPVTIHEFADVKCPACQQFEVNSQKENVDKLVRTGKANLRVHLVNIIDPNVGTEDGAKGRVAVNNLAASNQFFAMLSMNYFNQGDESTTWITENKYKDIAKVAGIDPSKINFRETPGSRALAAEADSKFKGLGAQGTPAFFVQARGTSAYTAVDSSVGAIEAGVEKATKSAKPAAAR